MAGAGAEESRKREQSADHLPKHHSRNNSSSSLQVLKESKGDTRVNNGCEDKKSNTSSTNHVEEDASDEINNYYAELGIEACVELRRKNRILNHKKSSSGSIQQTSPATPGSSSKANTAQGSGIPAAVPSASADAAPSLLPSGTSEQQSFSSKSPAAAVNIAGAAASHSTPLLQITSSTSSLIALPVQKSSSSSSSSSTSSSSASSSPTESSGVGFSATATPAVVVDATRYNPAKNQHQHHNTRQEITVPKTTSISNNSHLNQNQRCSGQQLSSSTDSRQQQQHPSTRGVTSVKMAESPTHGSSAALVTSGNNPAAPVVPPNPSGTSPPVATMSSSCSITGWPNGKDDYELGDVIGM